MLIEEAYWFSQAVRKYGENQFPLLNIGSGSEIFRKVTQPWIDRYLFAPIKESGRNVKHLDSLNLPGVDWVGDISNDVFLKLCREAGFKSILCNNFLEHVENPRKVAGNIVTLLSEGGILFVSCPFAFPFHPDPIDTLFRPNVLELSALFPNTKLLSGEIICGGTLLSFGLRSVLGNPGGVLRKMFLKLTKDVSSRGISKSDLMRWLLKPLKVTCLVLQKTK